MPPRVRFVYTGIRVRSLARSLRFYRRLGFEVVHRGTFSHGGRYVHLAVPGSRHRLELNFYPKGSRYYEPIDPANPFDHLGFSARDPERWLTQVRRAGARFVMGYSDRPHQRLYFVRDPDGVWLGVYGPQPSDRSRPFPRRRTRTPPTSRTAKRRAERRSTTDGRPQRSMG